MRSFIDESREPAEILSGAHRLMDLALDDRDECDAILSRHAKHWDLQRLALVDRNILRLAIAEIRAGRTPFKVAITEAIKMAQEFSTAESPRFINGVLDAVARELRKDDEHTARPDADEQEQG